MNKGTKGMNSCHVSSYHLSPEMAPRLFALTWHQAKRGQAWGASHTCLQDKEFVFSALFLN